MAKKTAKRAYRIVQYVEGYRRQPENKAWGRLGAKLLAQRVRQGSW